MQDKDRLDCVILGAGPAGLTALTYLARFHRRALALGADSTAEDAQPRVLLIDRSYNLPGYPEGMPGQELLQNLRQQAEDVGGEVRCSLAQRVEGCDGDFTIHLQDGQSLQARKIILAMGVRDIEPDIPGISSYIGDFIRYCPICDGYEHTDKRLGILGCGPAVARHALFLRSFSNRVSVFLHGAQPEALEHYQEILADHEIDVHSARVAGIMESDGDPESDHRGCGIYLEDGTQHPLAVLYSALGCNLNLGPVEHLPLEHDEEGYIVTDLSQASNIPGIYAVGDIASQLNQISIAFGQGAVAAINVHNTLDDQ